MKFNVGAQPTPKAVGCSNQLNHRIWTRSFFTFIFLRRMYDCNYPCNGKKRDRDEQGSKHQTNANRIGSAGKSKVEKDGYNNQICDSE